MRKRILIATLFSVVSTLATLGVVSTLSVQSEIAHSLQQSLDLAAMTANYGDSLLRVNMARLYDVSLAGSVDLSDGKWEPEREALRTAFGYSLFGDGLFIADREGRVVLSYPRSQIASEELAGIPEAERALRENRPGVSGLRVLPASGRRALFAFAPLRDKTGKTVGLVGGEIDPAHPYLQNLVRSLPDGSPAVIELVDGDGVVIASSNPERVFACSDRSRYLNHLMERREKAVFRCHRCHLQEGGRELARSTDILAFAPLQEAPWGVAVREPESNTFSASMQLRSRFLALALVVLASSFVLAVALGKSIVKPLQGLTAAAARIAGGRLEEGLHTGSRDEIGALERSFETMRVRLAETLGSLQRSNQELERRIAERTRELEASKERLASLLHKVMSAQEDERKRIARELHDETTQSAAALGLSIEIASMAMREGRLAPRDLLKLKTAVDRLIDGINGLIQDLRPPMLDDLGLASAVRWLLEKHLGARQIHFRLKCSEEFKRMLEQAKKAGAPPRLELTLFRIIQEAIVNIAKHSKAANVSVSLLGVDNGLRVLVQDDGVGFDPEAALSGGGAARGSGYGMLGMLERVALLGGELGVDSSPGEGCALSVHIPCDGSRREDGSNPGDGGR